MRRQGERGENTTVISLCQYRSIIGTLRDLIECESNRRAVTTWNRVMQHCMQSGLWAGEILALRQEKQSLQPRGLAIFKHAFGLGCSAARTTAKADGGVLQPGTEALSQHTELQRRNKNQRRVFSRELDLVPWKDLIIFRQFATQRSDHSPVVLRL